MADDRDLASILPDAPPPRPAGRKAAIDAAMRRFDGEQIAPASTRPAPEAGRWWRPVGAVASVALVAVLSVSFWPSERAKLVPPETPAVSVAPAPSADVAAPDAKSPAPPAARAEPPASPAPAVAEQVESVEVVQITPAPAEPAGVVAERVSPPAAFAPPPPPPPPPPASKAIEGGALQAAGDEEVGNIVVTAARRSSRAPSPVPLAPLAAQATMARGDWNACTVEDPARALDQCRRLTAGAPTAFAEGLSAAWRGDDARALAAFDATVRRARSFADGYLNRGLVHARQGNLEAAIADLDRAIRLDPNAARSYYQRSLLHARAGAAEKAGGDARRALRLDPAYRAVIR